MLQENVAKWDQPLKSLPIWVSRRTFITCGVCLNTLYFVYSVSKSLRFFSAHFLQVKFWYLGRVIGRQIDTQTWSLISHSRGSEMKPLAFACCTKSCCIQEMKKKKRDMKAKSVCCRGQSENRILTEHKKKFTSY